MDPACEYRNTSISDADLAQAAKEATGPILIKTAELVEKLYHGSYLANVFKNAQKNRDLDSELSNPTVRSAPHGENLAFEFPDG